MLLFGIEKYYAILRLTTRRVFDIFHISDKQADFEETPAEDVKLTRETRKEKKLSGHKLSSKSRFRGCEACTQ